MTRQMKLNYVKYVIERVRISFKILKHVSGFNDTNKTDYRRYPNSVRIQVETIFDPNYLVRILF